MISAQMLLFCRGKVTVVEEHLKHHKHVQKMYEELLADVPGVKVKGQPSLPPSRLVCVYPQVHT